jgi:hypothetical protein
VLLYRQVVPILASRHHTRVHLLTAAYRGHRHAFRIGFHKIVVHYGMSICHTGHPARRLRGLLRRFSSINVQIPFGFDCDFLVLHCLFLALLNRGDALPARGGAGGGARILLLDFTLIPLMPRQILLLRLHKRATALDDSLLD